MHHILFAVARWLLSLAIGANRLYFSGVSVARKVVIAMYSAAA